MSERRARRRVYLDWNATTPPLDEVVEAMARAAHDAWANPASVHEDGRRARAHVEAARARVADLAGADPRDVILTAGGTEANNLAVRSFLAPPAAAGEARRGEAGEAEERGGRPAAARSAGRGGALITSRLEHPSVTRVAEAHARAGGAVRWLAIDPRGAIDPDDLARALGEGDAALVALQAVNHETGVVQPIAEAIALASARGVPVHVDAVQAFGRVAVAALEGAATRSLAGHKIRGPKGIGALITRPRVAVEPILVGGAQERGVRPGTVDAVAAAGLAVAAAHARAGPARYARIAELRDRLEAALLAMDPGARVNGGGARAPHVTNVSFSRWAGAELVAALDLEGVSASSGSACSAGTVDPSPVIAAMHGEARARSAVRLSLGESTGEDDVALALAAFGRVLSRG